LFAPESLNACYRTLEPKRKAVRPVCKSNSVPLLPLSRLLMVARSNILVRRRKPGSHTSDSHSSLEHVLAGVSDVIPLPSTSLSDGPNLEPDIHGWASQLLLWIGAYRATKDAYVEIICSFPKWRHTQTQSYRNQSSLNCSRNAATFMEPAGSLPCSQGPSTGPYPETYKSSPHPYKISLDVILSPKSPRSLLFSFKTKILLEFFRLFSFHWRKNENRLIISPCCPCVLVIKPE
jgi:hypothetical protein